jgi:HPr kinase/phosphorylase
MILHASVVAVDGAGVLILGASGAGKSGLALRMIALGALLVSDDQVLLERCGDVLVARAPETLSGLIEARGVGILHSRVQPEAVVQLAVDLDQPPAARMPQRETITYSGVRIDLIRGRDVPNIDIVLTIVTKNGRAAP